MERLTYKEFKNRMLVHNRANKSKTRETTISGVIVITRDSFDKEYSLEGRSYCVSSDNKAFMDDMSGYSIYGSAIDGSDNGVRLDIYLREENGSSNGWVVEYCYFL